MNTSQDVLPWLYLQRAFFPNKVTFIFWVNIFLGVTIQPTTTDNRYAEPHDKKKQVPVKCILGLIKMSAL